MRILVCGGRDYSDRAAVDLVLTLAKPSCVIHGAQTGADTLAGDWAKRNGVPVEVYPADWKRLKYAAGPIRNQQMLDEGKPDYVIAFPGGVGTADMVRRAKKAGLKVVTP